MIDYIGRGCKKHPRYLNLDENFMVKDIEAFKAYLENSWFDRSGDTDGIAVGSGNEIKYANADDFESKNPSLFQKMYNHWISNPDDTFGTDSSFSWESKARAW